MSARVVKAAPSSLTTHEPEACPNRMQIQANTTAISDLKEWQERQNGSLRRMADSMSELKVGTALQAQAASSAASSAADACESIKTISAKVDAMLGRLFWAVVSLGATVVAAILIAAVTTL